MPTETLQFSEGRSGLSWPGIVGGAVVATAVTVMLSLFGAGLGLSAMSPLSRSSNPSGMTFTVLAAVWLLVTQWVASFFGGYLAGRLRPSLRGVHTHEVTFRDTASGFVSWALGGLLFAALLGSGASSLLSHATHGASMGMPYSPGMVPHTVMENLMRAPHPDPAANRFEVEQQARTILSEDAISPQDHDYLVAAVIARTGLPPDDATHRVDAAIAAEKQAVQDAKSVADKTRKASSALALYTAFSMLVGAFIASVAGAIGGKQRDVY